MRRVFLVCVGIGIAAVLSVIAARTLASSAREDCAMPKEIARPLDLEKPADREHLQQDLALVARTAERYRDYIRTVPMGSRSVHARATMAARPERAYRYCMAILTEQVATIHHLDAVTLADKR